MMTWFRRVFGGDEPPEAPTPDVAEFITRQRASRAEAITTRRDSERITRQLRQGSRDFSETLRVPPLWRREGDRPS